MGLLLTTEIAALEKISRDLERLLHVYRTRSRLTGYEADGIFDGIYAAMNAVNAALATSDEREVA